MLMCKTFIFTAVFTLNVYYLTNNYTEYQYWVLTLEAVEAHVSLEDLAEGYDYSLIVMWNSDRFCICYGRISCI